MKNSTSLTSAHISCRSYALFFLLVLLLLPWIGAEPLSFSGVLDYLQGQQSAHGLILFRQRIPRVLLALAVGGGLSIAGAALQVLFRNPLAEPWTLGVSGGAAIGAFLAFAFPAIHRWSGIFPSGQLLALAGAGAVMLFMLGMFRRRRGVLMETLLLGGVTISVFSGGLMMLAMYFVAPHTLVSFHRWMMGGLDVIGYREVFSLLIFGTPGMLLLLRQAGEYNHLALGEEMAMGHGVDVRRVQRWTVIGAGLTTAACVALAGPIAFIGMVIPHLVRHGSGVDNRIVLPGSFLLGGAVLALCDALARTAIAPTEIPVGILTAVAGGPVFLYLLTRR